MFLSEPARDTELAETKRALPDLAMRALALGHCIAGMSGVSQFHCLRALAHDVGCGGCLQPMEQ